MQGVRHGVLEEASVVRDGTYDFGYVELVRALLE